MLTALLQPATIIPKSTITASAPALSSLPVMARRCVEISCPVPPSSCQVLLTRPIPSCHRHCGRTPCHPMDPNLTIPPWPVPAPPWAPPWQLVEALKITQEDAVMPMLTWYCPMMSMPKMSWPARSSFNCLSLARNPPCLLHQPTTSSVAQLAHTKKTCPLLLFFGEATTLWVISLERTPTLGHISPFICAKSVLNYSTHLPVSSGASCQ